MRITASLRRLVPLFVLRLAAFTALGCNSAPVDEAPSPGSAPAPEALIAGWTCATPEACLGLSVGRVKTFERKVGARQEAETWTVLDRKAVEGGTRYVQDGGPAAYELRGDALWTSLRGEMLEALRFPVRVGDNFSIERAHGGQVTMTVREALPRAETPAGTFEHCLIHEARFRNREQPDREGLVVETTLCENIGEVSQQIRLPETPLPVEFTLLSLGNEA